MKLQNCLPSLLFLLTLTAVAAAGAETGGLVAYVAKNGEVAVRRADTEALVARIQPGLFEATWQFRAVSGGGDAKPGGETEGVIRAAGGKSPVRVRGEVRPEGTRLRLRYTLTPEGPLSVNSVHVSVNLPAGPWIGGSFSSPGTPGG